MNNTVKAFIWILVALAVAIGGPVVINMIYESMLLGSNKRYGGYDALFWVTNLKYFCWGLGALFLIVSITTFFKKQEKD